LACASGPLLGARYHGSVRNVGVMDAAEAGGVPPVVVAKSSSIGAVELAMVQYQWYSTSWAHAADGEPYLDAI
jgi:hypothetical protein